MCVGKWGCAQQKGDSNDLLMVINHCFLWPPMFKPAWISSFRVWFKIGWEVNQINGLDPVRFFVPRHGWWIAKSESELVIENHRPIRAGETDEN